MPFRRNIVLIVALAQPLRGGFMSPLMSSSRQTPTMSTPTMSSATMSSTMRTSKTPLATLQRASPLQTTLPALGYTTLGAVSIGAAHLIRPYLAWKGLALVGGCVGLPIAMLVAQFEQMGGIGVAKALGGKPAPPHIVALAAEAAKSVGSPTPANVFIIMDKKEPNALATGLRSKDATVAVTSGLVSILNDRELKAVLAHEMGHLKNHDVNRNMHVAVATVGLGGIFEAGRYLLRSRRYQSKKEDKQDNTAAIGVGLMAAGLASQSLAHLLRLGASRSAELRADAAAAEAFGADALISALTKISSYGARHDDLRTSAAGRAYAFAMISGVPSDGEGAAPSSSWLSWASTTANKPPSSAPKSKGGWWQRAQKMLRTHPGLEERVQSLESLVESGDVRR